MRTRRCLQIERLRAILVAALLVLTAIARGSAQQPTFPARVELVTVDVVVLDRQGHPVADLTRDDVTVREDGRTQTVAAFEAVSPATTPPAEQPRPRVSTNAEQPDAAARWFFVVFDDVHITPFATPRAREAMVRFIEHALRPGDRVMLAPSSGGSNWIGELPRDREALVAFVQRLQGERRPETGAGRIWDHEAMGIALGRDPQAQAQVTRRYFENNLLMEGAVTPSDPESRRALDVSPGIALIRTRARQVYTEARSRMQVSLGTLERMAASLAGARGRKTLLVFSEGFIADTTLENFRTLLRAARNANVAIHFVDVSGSQGAIGQAGLPGGNAEAGAAIESRDATTALALAARDADGARAIAADTGGSTISGSDLMVGLARVANEGRSYYLLGYSPTNTRRDGRFRRIEVAVNRPGVTVRARGGYFAGSDGREVPAPSSDALDPAVRAALDSPFGAPGIPLRLTSHVFGPQGAGRLQTVLVAHADPAPLQLAVKDGRYTAVLDSYVLVHDRSRGSLERNERLVEISVPADAFAEFEQRGIPLQRELALEPGHYQATLLLRDRATGAIGSVRHEFDVPPLDGFRITTPIITDTIQPPAAGGQPPRPVPVAYRTFKAGTRIAAAFDVYGAADAGSAGAQVSAAYSLRRSDGTEVSSSPPQPLKPDASGLVSVTVGLTLPAGAAGEHDLHLSVRDERAVRVIEHVERLTITP